MEDLLVRLVERVEGRFYGKYRGFVVDNADPEKRGRLRVRVPSVLGDEVVSGWAMPCAPYGGGPDLGALFIPEVEAGVWVEFEMGLVEYPIWVGAFWCQPGGEPETPKPNDPDGAAQGSPQDAPTRKIFKSVKGHTIQFEDADGDELVLVVENTNANVIAMNKDGITVTDGANSNTVELTASGVTITDKNGNVVEMSDSAFKITSKVAFTIDARGQAVEVIGKTIDFKKG
jgi:filamentous hemagglutinin family protein